VKVAFGNVRQRVAIGSPIALYHERSMHRLNVRTTGSLLALALGLALSACGSIAEQDPDGSVTPDVQVEPGDFTLSAPASSFVRPDGTQDLAVSVVRGTGFTDPVALSITGLPAGVTAEPVTVAADATSATVHFTAAASAVVGAQATLDLVASGGTREHTANVRFIVAGAPGALDTTFGDGGTVIEGVSQTASDYAVGAWPQDDGKIVAVANSGGIVLLRFVASGDLDSGFGTAGKVTETFSDLGAVGVPSGHALPQRDGSIVVVGAADVDPATDVSQLDIFVRRYTKDGARDAAFTGRRLPFSTLSTSLRALAIGPNDEIVLGGTYGVMNGTDDFVARLDAGGEPDTLFGSGGMRSINLGTDDNLGGVAVGKGGEIYVACGVSGYLTNAGYLLHFTRTAGQDTSFAGDGARELVHSSGLHQSYPTGVAVDADDTIRVWGSTYTTIFDAEATVWRFDATGAAVRSFNEDGIWILGNGTATENPPSDTANSVGVAGSYFIAGLRMVNFAPTGLVISQVDAAGEAVPGFGTAGMVTTTLPFQAYATIANPDERRVTFVGGAGGYGTDNTALVRIWY